MLKKLLGQKELEEQIKNLKNQLEHLELEKKSLTARLAARENSARKAVSQKQVVEEELNVAEKRIETLEHELTRMRKKAEKDISFQSVSSITRQRLEKYLFQISSVRTKDSSLVTVYLRPGDSLSDLTNRNELLQQLGPETIWLVDKLTSSTGVIVFYDIGQMVREVVVPFLPVEISSWQISDKFNIHPLQQIIEREPSITLILVHAGESFIGLTHSPESFISHQIVRSSVKGKHTKGGWSQRRFEKLRDEDIHHHLEKVSSALRTMIKESSEEIDLIVASGDTRLVFETLKDLNYPVIERSLDVSVDKKNVDKILKGIWSSKRYEI